MTVATAARVQSRSRKVTREQLITQHLDTARRIARKVARRVPRWINVADLESAAMLGLVEAAARFDQNRPESFVSFAEQRIRGAVLDELRRGDVMSRRARNTAQRVGRTMVSLQQKLGRAPEDEEVAAELQVSVEKLRTTLEGLTDVTVLELSPALEQVLADDHLGTEDEVVRRQLVVRVREALQRLQPRDQQVLYAYYVEERPYAEIGRALGVTESRVCQLHGRAIASLRALLRDLE